MRILTLNPGSSSLKAALVDDGRAVGWQAWTVDDLSGHTRAVAEALSRWPAVDAVALRFVHGGSRTGPAPVDDALLTALERLAPLAPLHQPVSLSIAGAVRATRPDLPLVASFDTAFHSGLPEAAARYPLPRSWTRQNRLRRYGFHGLSCQYAVRRTAELLDRPVRRLRVVVCHVGAGVSVTAVRSGQSADTSMGFTALEGAVMATRSGSVDPGLLLHLLRTEPMTPDELADTLWHRSGLAGMSGTSGDLRAVLAAARGGDDDARTALDVYLHRLRREIGAVAMSLDHLDAVVFTGGVAQHQPEVIATVVDGLGALGLHPSVAGPALGDRLISPPGAAVPVLIVIPREDLELAREAELLCGQMPGACGRVS
ncbi:acetate/propionate family kinase [Amycolatopsis suaedae]|uniref:Acetate kinase n=1 Tax=Amycolatopsis suaedae TaxID=2510978 RepID=A0A4Q7JG13_9PSEU|nr:acetate kinase [Amycolatopsis suaedae]RZQ65913.1 acetate kinase [Amycolatopsis suaedae]